MPFCLRTIKEQIELFSPSYISWSNEETQIDRVMPLKSSVDIDASKTLYIGRTSELPARYPVNVICIEDIPVSSEQKKSVSSNLIILPKTTIPGEIYCALCNLMLDNDRTLITAADLLTSLAKARGLESIVNNAYTALGNPVIISDNCWKALAIASDIKETDDIAWNEYMTNGALSLKTVSVNIKEKLADRIEKSETPICCQEANMKYPRLYCRVTIGSRTVATVSVIGYNRPFVERDYLLITMLANAASAEMQKNKFLHYTRGLLYEEFIVNLIEGRINNSGIIEDKVKSLNIELKQYIYIITVNIKEFDVNCFSVPYMRDYLEKMIGGSKALIYNDNIVVLSSFKDERGFFDSDVHKLQEFLNEYQLHAGISRPFRTIAYLKEHYIQSLDALYFGSHIDSERSIYFYDNYSIYQVARVCSNTSDLKRFCHPKLVCLMEYDAEHNTSFSESLYVYLKNSRNITNAAEALHLHRNSFIYHLKRIEEILNLSLSDSDILLHIELSFRLIEYENKFSRGEFNNYLYSE
jgi:sugar diacid utilization regulator